jgi:hypothetical protein
MRILIENSGAQTFPTTNHPQNTNTNPCYSSKLEYFKDYIMPPCYVDTNGNYYQDTSAHNPSDSMLTNPSAALVALLTATPVTYAVVELSLQTSIDTSGQGNGGDF